MAGCRRQPSCPACNEGAAAPEPWTCAQAPARADAASVAAELFPDAVTGYAAGAPAEAASVPAPAPARRDGGAGGLAGARGAAAAPGEASPDAAPGERGAAAAAPAPPPPRARRPAPSAEELEDAEVIEARTPHSNDVIVAACSRGDLNIE